LIVSATKERKRGPHKRMQDEKKRKRGRNLPVPLLYGGEKKKKNTCRLEGRR